MHAFKMREYNHQCENFHHKLNSRVLLLSPLLKIFLINVSFDFQPFLDIFLSNSISTCPEDT